MKILPRLTVSLVCLIVITILSYQMIIVWPTQAYLHTNSPTIYTTPTATPESEINQPEKMLQVEEMINLGIEVGNVTAPRHLAFDPETSLLYVLSTGIPILAEGNGLSIYDPLVGEFIDHFKLEGQLDPTDLQLDTETDTLYILRDAPLNSDSSSSLTVVDSSSLWTIEEIPDVEAIAVAENLLYTASLNELTLYRRQANRLTAQLTLPLFNASTINRLAVNTVANRLYLARQNSNGWGVDIFEADTLTPLNTFSVESQIIALIPAPTTQDLFVVENQFGNRFVHRLTPDGNPLGSPYSLGEGFGQNDVKLSSSGVALYSSSPSLPILSSSSTDPVPGLILWSTTDFETGQVIPLPTTIETMVFDAEENRAFAVPGATNDLYEIDLETGVVQNIPTAIELKDMIYDATSDHFFVSDSTGQVRRFDSDFQLEAEIILEGVDFSAGPGGGELAIDPLSERLFVSGEPAFVLDLETLAPLDVLRPGGQITLNSATDTLYLSRCGVTTFEATSLISQSVIAESTRSDSQFVPNPCVTYSQVDTEQVLLYSLADNGVPGSNGGNMLQVYDLTLSPTLVFTDPTISAIQVLPDPTQPRAFLHHVNPSGDSVLRTLDTSTNVFEYQDQLRGLSGPMLLNPETERLYLNNATQLVTIDSDTLDIIDQAPLTAEYNYQLTTLNPTDERLYLIGRDGQVLVVRDSDEPAALTRSLEGDALSIAPPRPANSDILEIVPLADGDILARIESINEFETDIRLYLSSDQGITWRDLSANLQPHQPIQAVTAISSSQALSIYAAHAGGIYQSTDKGLTWNVTMKGLQDISVNRLFAASDTDQIQIFANTLHAGLHYSNDGGENWTALTTLDANSAIFAQPDNVAAFIDENTALARRQVSASPQTYALFTATISDEGELSQWQQTLPIPLSLLAVALDGQTILGYANGLWRSSDAGQSWQPGGAGLTDLEITSPSHFLFSPEFTTDQTAYLFFRDIRGNNSGRLFRSTDTGETWQRWENPFSNKNFTTVTVLPNGDLLLGDDETQLTELQPNALDWVSPTSPNSLFQLDDLVVSPSFAQDQTLFAISHEHGIFKSSDGGNQWQPTDFPVRSTTFEPYRLAISPAYAQDQTLFVATGFSLHRSTDGGQTWQNLSAIPSQSGFAAEQIAISPEFATDQTVLVSTSEGILRSTDGGDQWEAVLTRPEEAGRSRVLTFSPTSDSVYVWFDYSSDIFVSPNAGQRWNAVSSRTDDSGFAILTSAIGPDDTLIARPDFSPQLVQVTQQGQIRQALNNVLPNSFWEIRALVYTSQGTLIAGGPNGLLESTDDGLSWLPLSNNLPPDASISHLYATQNHLFVILNSGQLFVSDDDGRAWQDISVVK